MITKYQQQPFADLRREPSPFAGNPKDPLQETQLICGEQVHVLEEKGEWTRVQLPHQQKFDKTAGKWIGYPGWVESHFLADTCPIPPRKKKYDPDALIEEARKFIGTPYLWGGATPHDPANSKMTGVDCSGLVHLLHKMQGIYLPRDAHDLWLKRTPIAACDLNVGDLVFIELKDKPGRMDHVMLFAKEGKLIEAVINPGVVREIGFEERVGISLKNCLNHSFQTDKAIFFFGKMAI